MHGRITVTHKASTARSGCEDCLLSPECPACADSDSGIEVHMRILHRGDRLVRPGEPFDTIYMVRSGMIKTCTMNPSGDEQVIGFYTPGNLLGLDAIQVGRHQSSAIALETTSVCSLPYEPLCRLGARLPHVQRRLLERMSQRICDDGRRLAMLAMRGAGQRLASFLIGLVDIRCSRGLQRGEIPLPMQRADIASYLVLAVETVSRSLSRQQEAGLIEVHRNRIRILDEPALRATAGDAGGEAAAHVRSVSIGT